MRFNPVRAFTNPATRPRAIVWSMVALLGFAVFWAVGIVGTSYEWFCTSPCHMVHDDNTLAYKASTHTNASCIACHEPANADPITMTLMKIHVLPDLPATIFGDFEVPVNPSSYVAVEFPDDRCLQCHNLDNREVTPTQGIIIDHAVHTQNDVTCATCHNRVAHPEKDITLVLGDRKHDDWMTMDACFRCHSLEADAKAPGACAACHPADFDLVPPSHDAEGWYARFGTSKAHAAAAKEESETVAEAAAHFAQFEPVDEEHAEGPVLMPSSAVDSCTTCHKKSFCADCHGLPMPHPAEFATDHGADGYARPQVCANCHARNAAEASGTAFCNACHHPASRPGESWQRNHRRAVIDDGANACFKCHEPGYCEACHVRGPAAAERYAREAAGTP